MGKLVVIAGAGVLALVLALAGCAGAVLVVVGGGAPGASGATTAGGGSAVPASWEALERAAATTCPGLAWGVLAAIGRVESDSGRSDLPGVHTGANAAGAEGPMQFEPATFAEYATVGPGGEAPPSPYDPVDAVYTAATMLCANGGGSQATLQGALFAYNHTASYVDTIEVLAAALTTAPTLRAVPATAIGFAASQLGVPYVWGGTGPDGYDCSGLVQAAYGAAGVTLPRVAQTQFDAGPPVPAGARVRPGDLVFFGASAATVEHVGIYVGDGEMVDAPYTGTVVRLDPAGSPAFVGATDPGA